MKHVIKKLISDPVLIVAWILALFSAFIVHPDIRYKDYIDFRSLGILWGLMIIIQGLRENTVFEKIGDILLRKVKKSWQLVLVLIFICFISSMFITNDVALITFVPFALLTLHSCKREDLMIPVIVLQTIAANLGSMLTPIGNPQNLYLYGLTQMGLFEFMGCMLPYTLVSAFLLFASIAFLPGKAMTLQERKKDYGVVKNFGSQKQIIVFSLLFVLALATVLNFVPWQMMTCIIFIVVLIMNDNILLRADYILLLTFIGFFIFTGNMARIPQVSNLLTGIIEGKEFYTAIITSQFISNVPATLMLSGFADDYRQLLAGVNVGGLGTLIASMASLISFKAYSNDYKENGRKYIVMFTLVNIIFLVFLILLHTLIGN